MSIDFVKEHIQWCIGFFKGTHARTFVFRERASRSTCKGKLDLKCRVLRTFGGLVKAKYFEEM